MAGQELLTAGAQLLNNPAWRLNNLYAVTDKEGQEVDFRLNWAQEELLRDLHCLNIVLKARQLGCTTFFSLLMLDACLFNPNVRAGIIAHTREDAEEIFRDKVKFPYEKICERFPDLAKCTEAHQDSVRSLLFSNNSQFRVGVSLRSGTFQWLLITEYGKVCAKYPEKAREIRTGALNTVQAGQFITIESTAEGQDGDFYSKCQTAQSLKRTGAELTPLDFKFHFFPWWREPTYRLPAGSVPIPQEYKDYFRKLQTESGITIDPEQQAWYVKKAEQQQDDMKREYPSTPEEAFEAAVEGAIFARQFTAAERDNRITRLPVVSGVPVNTFWDIGVADYTSVWLHQRNGPWNDFIGYHEANGEGWSYFRRWLDQFAQDHDISYGKHYGPHDIKNRGHGVVKPRSVKEIAYEAGIRFEDAVPQPTDLWAEVQEARGKFGSCRFDETRCSEGLRHMRLYRKEWDEVHSRWRDRPHHDEHSHAASAFMTFTRGYTPPDYYPEPNWDDSMLTYGQDEVTGY